MISETDFPKEVLAFLEEKGKFPKWFQLSEGLLKENQRTTEINKEAILRFEEGQRFVPRDYAERKRSEDLLLKLEVVELAPEPPNIFNQIYNLFTT